MHSTAHKNKNRQLTVVILAAGLGTRLGELTKKRPKALTLVSLKPIIGYALPWARLLKPQKIIVVGGYLFPQLEEAVHAIDSSAVLVENKHFDTTQRMASLLAARGEIEGDLVVFDGDYIYHHSVANKIMPHLKGTMAIFGTREEHQHVKLDMMIHADRNNRLLDMSKELKEYQYYFNSFFYCPEHLLNAYFRAAEETIAEKGADKTHLEDAIVKYAQDGGHVGVVPIGEPLWIEIDNPQELAAAEQMIQKDPEGFGV